MFAAIAQLFIHLRSAGFAVRAVAFLKALGPYAAIELLLPGGTIIALLLWLYSRHRNMRQVAAS
jgi:hypothetical protein